MKFSMPFKLGIVVVLLFAVVLVCLFLYQPLRYHWLKSQLLSDNSKTRELAIKELACENTQIVLTIGGGRDILITPLPKVGVRKYYTIFTFDV